MAEKFTFESLLKAVDTWFVDVTKSWLEYKTRPWMLFGLTKTPSFQSVVELFDRSKLNQDIESGLKDAKPKEAAKRLDVDLIFGTHKCFALRHRTRIQYIRDDLSQKGGHVKGSLYVAAANYAKFVVELDKTDSAQPDPGESE